MYRSTITTTAPCHADALLAERGEVAITSEELHELRALAANGLDSAELAHETADLIALLHQARSSNATVSCTSCCRPDMHVLIVQGTSESMACTCFGPCAEGPLLGTHSLQQVLKIQCTSSYCDCY